MINEKLKDPIRELSLKHNMSVSIHSGGGNWVALSRNDPEAIPYSIELWVNKDGEVRVRATSMPVRTSMAQLTLGGIDGFSYPNKVFDRQMRVFREMVATLFDEFSED